MRAVVLGGSGKIGRELVTVLAARGVDVAAAQRSAGVDASTGEGLDEVFAGADVVVDCLNIATQNGKKAVDFFGTCARNVAAAVERTGVPRVVCLSIINAAEPAVHAKMGYYQGKSEQERVYRHALGERLAVVHSAQWFELAEQLLGTLKAGPVAAIPHMLSRPCALVEAAAVLADVTIAGRIGDVQVAGPEELDLHDLAKQLAERAGSPRWVLGINFGGPAIRGGGLLPAGEFVATETTAQEWLAGRGFDTGLR